MMGRGQRDNRYSPIIKSSELKQWAFCPRQWFLLRMSGRKVDNEFTRRGLRFHHQEARKFNAIKRTENTLTVVLIVGGVLFALFIYSLFLPSYGSSHLH
jgi:hypothetical protein